VGVGSRHEGLLGPWQEPVDSGAVDEGREGSESSSEVLSNGGHADHHMEVGFAKRNKVLVFFIEGPDWLNGRDFFDYLRLFFRGEEIGNLPVV
jgi:hypothetical protein